MLKDSGPSLDMFMPPATGLVDETFLLWGTPPPTRLWSRGEAKQLFYPRWASFYHIGGAPPITNAAATYRRDSPQLDRGSSHGPRVGAKEMPSTGKSTPLLL